MLTTFILATFIVGILFGKFFIFDFNFQPKFSFTGFAINDPNLLTNLLIPSALTSIMLSIVGITTVFLLILRIRSIGLAKSFPFRSYLIAISIVFVIYAINYFVTFFPYGNIIVVLLTAFLQVVIYGILLPFILLAQIGYIILIFQGDTQSILR